MDLEQKVDALVESVGTLKKAMEEGFNAVDQRFNGVDQRFNAVDQRLGGIDQRLGGIDQRLDGVDKKLGKLAVDLDEVKAVSKLGLEGLEGLRESMTASFNKTDKKHEEGIDLLKRVSAHIRTRVQRLESPPRRRRG
jgi:tRNA A-37 threonylcarbamoyl transferase component Bud32